MITVSVEPLVEPVTLAEAKLHCRVDHTDEDDYIEGLIAAARQLCETFTGRAFVRQTIEYSLDEWPSGRAIHLPMPPFVAISEVKYLDADGLDVILVAGTDYIADTVNGKVVLPSGKTWPTETLYEVNPIVITYIAGSPRVDELTYTAEAVGTGDGIVRAFSLDNPPILSGSNKIYLAGVLTAAYTLDLTTGAILFTVAPLVGVAITADYKKEADYVINIPQYIKQAIKLLVGVYYENREHVLPAGHVGKTLPMGIDALLWQHRSFWTPELNK